MKILPRIAVSVIVGLFILIGYMLLTAPQADAHRPYASWQANQTVYNLWNSHCGNGFLWICVNRQLQLGSSPVGDHSWATYYSWYEAKINGGNRRWCDVYVRYDAHIGAVVQIYNDEACHT